MEPETYLLIASLIVITLDIANRLKPERFRELGKDYGHYLFPLSLLTFFIYYLRFIIAFAVDDFSIVQVYSYSSTGLSAVSKIFASWGGSGGSLLLLTLLIGVVTLLHWIRSGSATKNSITIMKIFLVFFILLTTFKDPMQRLMNPATEGMGLNPQLQTIWMISHPPIVFTGYALLLLVFALMLAKMNGEEVNEKIIGTYVSASWLFFTIGIATGGIWAYEVLGWGGYWAWDPVETTSLLPWLGLTAYIHLSSKTAGGGMLREVTLLTSFDSLIFLSALTRGGLTNSVHAYALSPAGPVLLLFALAVTIYFILLARRQNKPIFKLEGERKICQISTFASLIAFAGIFIVCLLGVIYPILQGLFTGSGTPTDPSYYTTWTYPFVLLFALSLLGCGSNKIGVRVYAMVVVGLLAAGVVAVVLRYPTGNAMANLGLPTLIGGLFATVYNIANSLRVPRSFSITGRKVVHLGVILILLGVFISSTSQQTKIYSFTQSSSISGDNTLTIKLVDTHVSMSTSWVYVDELESTAPEYTEIIADTLTTYRTGQYAGTLAARLYINYGYVAQPMIIITGYGDVYLHIDPSGSTYETLVNAYTGQTVQPANLYVVGEQVPLVYLIWVGVAMMIFGAMISLINQKNIQSKIHYN
jgi:cytochrome c-type biogenesis protein CcmF